MSATSAAGRLAVAAGRLAVAARRLAVAVAAGRLAAAVAAPRTAAAAALLAIGVAGCAAGDPCDGHAGACVSLRVRDGGGVHAIDQLAIHIAGAAHLDGATPPAPGPLVSLPVTTAIYLPDTGGALTGGVFGLLAGRAVGFAAISTTVAPRAHAHVELALVAALPAGDGGADLAPALADLAPPALDLGVGSDGGPGADLAGTAPRHVFLLPAQTSNLGAQATVDGQCATAGSGAGLPSTYRAVIAYPTSDPVTSLTLGQGRAIVLPDGTAVADDATFFSMAHAGPIDELADGTRAPAGCVFTDFGYGGARISANNGDCGGWTGDITKVAYVGDSSKSDGNWSFTTPIPSCANLSCYIYCIEQ